MILHGPFAFDPAAPKASGTAALAEAEELLRLGARPTPSEAAEPGLYLVWRELDTAPAIAGFWLVLGLNFLSDGLPQAPEGVPPVAAELLDAATEHVWWRTLHVWPEEGGVWRPLVVIEWPPELASRAAIRVPGVAVPEPTERRKETEDEEAGWLDIGTEIVERPEARRSEDDAPTERGLPPLPSHRSIVTVIAGELKADRKRHVGRFHLIGPAALPETVLGQPSPIDHWWKIATAAPPFESEEAKPPALGEPLGLPGQRVGFPIAGWLLRTLEPWPEAVMAILPGELRSRDVGSRWRLQVAIATSITLGILAAVFVVFILLERAVTWPAEELPAPATMAPQPGLSICSAEPQRFKEELRCQLAALGQNTGTWGMGNCGDARGADGIRSEPPPMDVRAAWCGLRDRVAVDGAQVFEAGPGADITWAEVAASQACFNSLGQPYAYQLDESDAAAEPGTRRADPRLFLLDTGRRLQGLADVVSELDQTCDRYSGQLAAAVEGAIFTEHLGQPDDRRGLLAKKLLTVARAGMDTGQVGCFNHGVDQGLPTANSYDRLCGGAASPPPRSGKEISAWAALAPEGELPESAPSVLSSYVDARFGQWDVLGQRALLPGEGTPGAWRCHLTLNDPEASHFEPAASDPLITAWGQRLPVPSRYGEGRPIRNQLTLDAALQRMSEQPGMAVGDCWGSVVTRIARYKPVHPLLPDRAPTQWPSEEQQLCGQVCATYFRYASSPESERWFTREGDLQTCVSLEKPELPPKNDDNWRPRDMENVLDELHLVWNGWGRGDSAFLVPTEAEVCSFNLIAQGYLAEQGWALPDNVAPPLWAGDLDSQNGLAGGRNGGAYVAADGMSTYGRSRSRATCGAVAAQCFVGGMLGVMGDQTLQPYAWSDHWQRWVAGQTPGGGLPQASPWCKLITPFMSPAGELPEGELDYPCAVGVEDMRLSTAALLSRLSGGGVGAEGNQP